MKKVENCHVSDCPNDAKFGQEKGKPIYCKVHKALDMHNVVDDALCMTPVKGEPCGKKAIYNYRSTTEIPRDALYCEEHKIEGMVNSKFPDRLTPKCWCGKKAEWNYKDRPPKYCKTCKSPDMVQLFSKKS